MEKARILIVEDEAIIAMEIESQLQSLGYKVTSIVNTGEKAIQKAESDKPDLILMDIRIKGEMDGIDTAEIIKNKVGIPVVFSTAYLDHGRIERAKIAMPFGYVLKPIQERDLKVTIEMALYVAKLQAERRRAEETYRNTFMNSQVGLFRTDIQTGKILDANNKVAHLIGFQNRDELLAQPFSIAERYVDTADREKMIQLLREQGKFENFEARFRRNDTSIIWMRYSAKLVPEKGWIEGVSEDITTEKKATQALKESENKYRSVIENANEAIIVLQGNEFKYVNPKTCEISGYSEEELYSKTFIDIIHPEDQGMIIDKYARRQRGELLAETYIFRFIGKKENIIWSEIKPVIIDWEGEVATLCFISDITERIQMVENLRKSQAQKQAILDGISINISFVNEKLELLWVNKTAAASVNKTPQEMLGHKCYEFWANPEKPCDDCPTIRAFQTGNSEHTIIHTPDGKIWRESGEPVLDRSGNVIGVVEIAQDITDQSLMETILQKNEKKYRTLFENSPYGVFLVDNDGKYVEVNKAACEMTGYTEEELLTLSIPEVSSRDEEVKRQDIKPFLDIQKTGKGEGIIHFKHKDGHIFRARLKGVKIDENTLMGICELAD